MQVHFNLCGNLILDYTLLEKKTQIKINYLLATDYEGG